MVQAAAAGSGRSSAMPAAAIAAALGKRTDHWGQFSPSHQRLLHSLTSMAHQHQQQLNVLGSSPAFARAGAGAGGAAPTQVLTRGGASAAVVGARSMRQLFGSTRRSGGGSSGGGGNGDVSDRLYDAAEDRPDDAGAQAQLYSALLHSEPMEVIKRFESGQSSTLTRIQCFLWPPHKVLAARLCHNGCLLAGCPCACICGCMRLMPPRTSAPTASRSFVDSHFRFPPSSLCGYMRLMPPHTSAPTASRSFVDSHFRFPPSSLAFFPPSPFATTQLITPKASLEVTMPA
jgi:hypothetical protein